MTRKKHFAILTRDELLFEQICTDLEHFSIDLCKRLAENNQLNHIYLWNIRLLLSESVLVHPKFGPRFKDSIVPKLSEGLRELFEELDRLNNNPYVKHEVYNNVAIKNMLPVLQNLKFFKPIISKTENVTAILNALINCSEENYDHRETVEEELYELRQYLSLESAAAVNKAIRSAASRLEQFASEEYIKEDDVKEQGKSYKADILLMVLDSLLAWLVESDSPVEPDTKKHTSKLYTALSKKILIKIQPILKTSL